MIINMQDAMAENTRIYFVHINTSKGRINFYTDTGNVFEASARLQKQDESIKWTDIHHAAYYYSTGQRV